MISWDFSQFASLVCFFVIDFFSPKAILLVKKIHENSKFIVSKLVVRSGDQNNGSDFQLKIRIVL